MSNAIPVSRPPRAKPEVMPSFTGTLVRPILGVGAGLGLTYLVPLASLAAQTASFTTGALSLLVTPVVMLVAGICGIFAWHQPRIAWTAGLMMLIPVLLSSLLGLTPDMAYPDWSDMIDVIAYGGSSLVTPVLAATLLTPTIWHWGHARERRTRRT